MGSILLRGLPYAIAIAVFLGVTWKTIDSAYEHGRKMERLEWMEHEETIQRQADIRIAQLEYKMKTERDKTDRRATQIIGAYANEIEKLHNDLTDAADHRLWISAKASACESGRIAMSSANKDTGQSDGEIRFEIPTPLGREIRRDYYDAEGLEVKRNTLIELVETRPDCFEVVR